MSAASPKPTDRLQPALLDRLLDDDPTYRGRETLQQRVMSGAQLRAAVLRDLESLFNATSSVVLEADSDFSHARSSVLTFGLPALAGRTAGAMDVPALSEAMRQAIVQHEPRIMADSLRVEVIEEGQKDLFNHIGFRIVGRLWAQPMPLVMMLQTDMDLDTGKVRVHEQSSRDMPRG